MLVLINGFKINELKESNFPIKKLKVTRKTCINFKMREINATYYTIKEFAEKTGTTLAKHQV